MWLAVDCPEEDRNCPPRKFAAGKIERLHAGQSVRPGHPRATRRGCSPSRVVTAREMPAASWTIPAISRNNHHAGPFRCVAEAARASQSLPDDLHRGKRCQPRSTVCPTGSSSPGQPRSGRMGRMRRSMLPLAILSTSCSTRPIGGLKRGIRCAELERQPQPWLGRWNADGY